MKSPVYLLILLLLLCGQTKAQQPYFAERTTEQERAAFIQLWQEKLRQWADSTHILSPGEISEFSWAAMAFKLDGANTALIFDKALKAYPSLEVRQRYDLLLARRAWSAQISQEILRQGLQDPNPRIQALAAYWMEELQQGNALELLARASPYRGALALGNQPIPLQEIEWENILKAPLFVNTKNLILLLPQHREHTGTMLVLQPGGQVVTTENGTPATFEYLGLSASNAPYFLTNGNTPAGLFSIQDQHQSDNQFIGPVPLLATALPFEVPEHTFRHQEGKALNWTPEGYTSLLPASLRSYSVMYQAYEAGKLGRSEIVVHGTTINPEFFKAFEYYPFTPSLGCVSGKELWNRDTGQLMESTHLDLMETFNAIQAPLGYMLVIQIPDIPVQDLNTWLQENLTK